MFWAMRDFVWPYGYRCAVCITWDMDGESAHYFRNPSEAANQLSELVQRSYGPNVAIWKVLEMHERCGVRATFFVPGYTANLHPDAVRAIHEHGHPLGLHGYLHETMDALSEEQEDEMFRLSTRTFEKLVGFRPKIFRSPSFELNRRTPRLLAKYGVVADSSLMGDDYPYILRADGVEIVELPVQWILDDFEFWGHTKASRQKAIADPEAVFRIWRAEFEGMYRSKGIFVLTLHPFVSGRWVFLDTVERLIRHIQGFPDVWITTVDEVASYCLSVKDKPFMVRREPPAPRPLSFEL